MNEEMTESYWYSKFVLGPHSSFQLLWAVLSIILITWDPSEHEDRMKSDGRTVDQWVPDTFFCGSRRGQISENEVGWDRAAPVESLVGR